MARRLRGAAAIAGRAIAVAAAIIVLASLATGWLYWLRAGVSGWPGPRVADALPLDEMPGHDSVPLLIYLAVLGLAATALGLVARALRLDRLTAGLGLAAGTGGWLLLAGLVAAGGAIDLVSALIPHTGPALGLMVSFAPRAVFPAAHVLLVPAGVLLLLTASALRRRNRRALRLAAGLLGLSAVLQLLRGPDYAAAVVTGLVAVALLARRDDFPYRGDPAARPSALLRLAGLGGFTLGYGVIAVWAYQTTAGLVFSFPAAVADTLRAMGGQLPPDVDLLPGEFADWFPYSVMSLMAIGIIWAAAVWIRPWRQRLPADRRRGEQAADIVRRWGADTLAPFALRADKEWFLAGQTLIAYRVIRGVALISGDPVGPPEDTGPALAAFLAHAQERGWRTAVIGASDRTLQTYRDHGLHPLYHGDEAVIDTGSFSLEGRAMRAVRQGTRRVERKGFRTEVVMAGEAPAALRAELAAVERAWLGDGARKGFTMELDSLFRLGGRDALSHERGADSGGADRLR